MPMRSIGFSVAIATACVGTALMPAHAEQGGRPEGERQVVPIEVQLDSMRRLHITTSGQVVEDAVIQLDRGSCQNSVTHTDASFEGGVYTAQAGFAEGEWAATSYTLSADQFPLIVNRLEMIFATSNASVTTTTEWSIGVWEGTPNSGNMVAMFSSDGVILPHLIMPPGTNGTNVLVEVDPSDPDQIVVSNNGTNTFTIGYRIDKHNNQTANPCFTAPPSSSNAFPVTDTTGLASPTGNWLFGLNCGVFGCPPNGGWVNFASLNVLCRPSGDWVMRATYTPTTCTQNVGACCVGDGLCFEISQADCLSLDGIFNGVDTSCANFTCATGACCLPDGSCTDGLFQSNCETNLNGLYLGDGTVCGSAPCPEVPQACCFPNGGCLNIAPSACIGAGGTPGGIGTNCANFNCNPLGACCLPDGSCVDAISPAACADAGGLYQGDNTTCASVTCPQPFGACCFDNGFCIEFTLSDCNIAGGNWAGPLTNCETGCNQSCPPDVSGDGTVNLVDLNIVLSQFGQTGSDLQGDADGNGAVDLGDLNLVLAAFGQDC